jgi:hypothetical protein
MAARAARRHGRGGAAAVTARGVPRGEVFIMYGSKQGGRIYRTPRVITALQNHDPALPRGNMKYLTEHKRDQISTSRDYFYIFSLRFYIRVSQHPAPRFTDSIQTAESPLNASSLKGLTWL